MTDLGRLVGSPVSSLAMSTSDLRYHIAVHEAAHAVVGISCQLELLEIDIGLNESFSADSMVAGRTQFAAPRGDQKQLAREQPGVVGLALMAGVCAEGVVLGCHLQKGWEGDLELVRIGYGWLDALTFDQQQALFRLIAQAHELVLQHESAIRRVASRLLEDGKLDGAEVRELARSGWGVSLPPTPEAF